MSIKKLEKEQGDSTSEELLVVKAITNEDGVFLRAIRLLEEINLTVHVTNVTRVVKVTADTASKWSRSLEDHGLVTRYDFKKKLYHRITAAGEAAFSKWSGTGEGKGAKQMFEQEFPPRLEVLLQQQAGPATRQATGRVTGGGRE